LTLAEAQQVRFAIAKQADIYLAQQCTPLVAQSVLKTLREAKLLASRLGNITVKSLIDRRNLQAANIYLSRTLRSQLSVAIKACKSIPSSIRAEIEDH